MTLSGRPLLGNHVDQVLFTGRTRELAGLADGVRRRFNCLVTGDPGSGRTSTLHALSWELRRSGFSEIFFVRATTAESGQDIFNAALRALDLPPTPVEDAGPVIEAYRSSSNRQGGHSSQIVFVVDDVAGDAGRELFGLSRDQLWSLDCQWVVAARAGQSPSLLTPPADAFFERVVELPPLNVAESTDLLKRRSVPPSGATAAATASNGNPRLLLCVARWMTNTGANDEMDVIELLAHRDIRVRSLNRAARMLLSELESLGGASASDSNLLASLGWTRPRVVQVLGELEQAGLVHSVEDVSARPGRPRKIYRPVSPVEFAAQDAAADE